MRLGFFRSKVSKEQREQEAAKEFEAAMAKAAPPGEGERTWYRAESDRDWRNRAESLEQSTAQAEPAVEAAQAPEAPYAEHAEPVEHDGHEAHDEARRRSSFDDSGVVYEDEPVPVLDDDAAVYEAEYEDEPEEQLLLDDSGVVYEEEPIPTPQAAAPASAPPRTRAPRPRTGNATPKPSRTRPPARTTKATAAKATKATKGTKAAKATKATKAPARRTPPSRSGTRAVASNNGAGSRTRRAPRA
jgi:hypothetical protein